MVKQANLHQIRLITGPLRPARECADGRVLVLYQLMAGIHGRSELPDEVAAGRRVLIALAHKEPRTLPDSLATRNAIRRCLIEGARS